MHSLVLLSSGRGSETNICSLIMSAHQLMEDDKGRGGIRVVREKIEING